MLIPLHASCTDVVLGLSASAQSWFSATDAFFILLFSARFYFGGSFYYKSDGLMRYNPGRALYGRGARSPCSKWTDCAGPGCTCREENQIPLNVTNTKSFLTAGVGFNSWNGLMNLMGYESYDSRLAFQALSKGFWLTKAYIGCRSGEALPLPSPATVAKMEGSVLVWYDTTQR